MYCIYILHAKKEREEDATEYALASGNIIHSECAVYISHSKKERVEDVRKYALGSDYIIHNVSVQYIYYIVKRRGRRMLQNIHTGHWSYNRQCECTVYIIS